MKNRCLQLEREWGTYRLSNTINNNKTHTHTHNYQWKCLSLFHHCKESVSFCNIADLNEYTRLSYTNPAESLCYTVRKKLIWRNTAGRGSSLKSKPRRKESPSLRRSLSCFSFVTFEADENFTASICPSIRCLCCLALLTANCNLNK